MEGAAHSDGRRRLAKHPVPLGSRLHSVEEVVLGNPRPSVSLPGLDSARHLLLDRNRAHLVHLHLVSPLNPRRAVAASGNRRSSVRSPIPSPAVAQPHQHLHSVPSRRITVMETTWPVPVPLALRVVPPTAPALLHKRAQQALLVSHSSPQVPRCLWTLAQLPPPVPLEHLAARTPQPMPLANPRNHLRTPLVNQHRQPHSPQPTLSHKLPLQPTHSAPRLHSLQHPLPRPVVQHRPTPTDQMRADSTRRTRARKP